MIVTCIHCRENSEAPERAQGKRVRCPHCDQIFAVKKLLQVTIIDEDAAQDAEEVTPVLVSRGDTETQKHSEPAPTSTSASTQAAPSQGNGAQDDEFVLSIDDEEQEQPQAIPAPMHAPTSAPAPTAASASASDAGESQDKTQAKSKDGWFVITSKGEIGPLPSSVIVKAAKQGKITPDTKLRHTRKDRVVRAREVPGLLPKSITEAPQDDSTDASPSTAPSGKSSPQALTAKNVADAIPVAKPRDPSKSHSKGQAIDSPTHATRPVPQAKPAPSPQTSTKPSSSTSSTSRSGTTGSSTLSAAVPIARPARKRQAPPSAKPGLTPELAELANILGVNDPNDDNGAMEIAKAIGRQQEKGESTDGIAEALAAFEAMRKN